MARMTATDMESLVRKRMGSPTTDEWTALEILRFINLAQMRLAMTHNPAELQTSTDLTMVVGQNDYEFAVDDIIKIVQAFNLTVGIEVKPDKRSDYIKRIGTDSIPDGVVDRYLENGLGANDRKQVTVSFTPTNADTIRVWYIKKPTELVLSPTATSSEMSEQWDEVLLDMATEIGRRYDQETGEAQAERQMTSETEQRAARSKPRSADRRYGIKSPIADTTKTRTRGRRR